MNKTEKKKKMKIYRKEEKLTKSLTASYLITDVFRQLFVLQQKQKQ